MIDGIRPALDHRLLSPSEETRLALAARGGDRSARERLVVHNLRLVAKLALRHAPPHMLEDRIQDGVVGLLKAVDRFDPDRGNRFSTYATWWVRKELLLAIEHDRLVRTPRREPQSEQTRTRAVDAAREPIRLDAPVQAPDGTPRTLADVVLGADDDAHDQIAEAERRRTVSAAVDRLGNLARDTVMLRFGFTDGTERTHAEIGERLGFSREKIRLSHNAALAELAQRPELIAQRSG